MKRIIETKRSVIVAADVPSLRALESLVEAMVGIKEVGAFKLGSVLGNKGLEDGVGIVKEIMGPTFPVIFDQQKAGTDIPETGVGFAEGLKEAGVDVAILFPLAGPATQEAWTKACFNAGLQVMTGGIMTHAKFLVSEDGYIADEAVEKIYLNACEWGCEHFIVPGTKLAWVKCIRGWLIKKLGDGNFTLSAPGLITQGGDISECGQAAGDEWHPIVGSAIYTKPTREAMREAAVAAGRTAGVPA